MKHLAEQWWSWCGVETTICLLVSTKPKTWLWTQQKLSMLHFKSRAWPWKGSAAQNSWLSTSETLSCGTQHHTPGQGDLGRGCTYTHTRAATHTYIYTILTIFYWSTIESILISCMVTDTKILPCVRMVEGVIRISLPYLETSFKDQCKKKALCIMRDSSKAAQGPFNPQQTQNEFCGVILKFESMYQSRCWVTDREQKLQKVKWHVTTG